MKIKFQINEMFQQLFKKPQIFRKKFGNFSTPLSEMDANFVLSQKGTNLLKDNENQLYNKYRECLFVCIQ